MSQFLIIAYPHESCGWVSILPDFVGMTSRPLSASRKFSRQHATLTGLRLPKFHGFAASVRCARDRRGPIETVTRQS